MQTDMDRSGSSPSTEILREVLSGPTTERSGAKDLAAGSRSKDWLLLPSGGTTLLVPRRGRAGASALFQFNDSMTYGARLAKAFAGWAIQVGLGPLIFHDRSSTPGSVVDGRGDLIESELPRILRVPRVEVAISLGRDLRPNIKPVLQVMTPDGRVLAFAKVAWNELTTQLVRNEGETLLRLERKKVRTFRAPRVIHQGRWHGFDLVLTSALPQRLLRRSRVDELPPSSVVREIAASLGSERLGPLVEGPYWQQVKRRALDAAQGLPWTDRVERIVSGLAAKWSGVDVIHCTSHGDFAPWNMARSTGSLDLWDWERASESRPLGVDSLHFCFEVAYHKQGRDPRAALDLALERSRPVLQDVGVEPPTAAAIRDVYALERLIRLLEGKLHGLPIDEGLAASLADALGAPGGAL